MLDRTPCETPDARAKRKRESRDARKKLLEDLMLDDEKRKVRIGDSSVTTKIIFELLELCDSHSDIGCISDCIDEIERRAGIKKKLKKADNPSAELSAKVATLKEALDDGNAALAALDDENRTLKIELARLKQSSPSKTTRKK